MPSTFSVFFEGPFWVGVLETAGPRGVRAARHVFGGEPGNAELPEFVRRDFGRLLDSALAAPEVADERRPRERTSLNPKWLARQAARESAARPLSTAAVEALERRAAARRQAKERHRGR
ncbi:YjdF family protein [Streptomyces sp. CBMA156]|uniref:YjdF family protein n=1 Tax=Streptomyces sp. CBMA156 TaxID=1930280 RepID=UPI0016621330|nr:YjdF family protein [Streptomyces sp. CBMA156]MBD0671237.1 hypothetical protein [Streptomyces sp. CBMA156]